MALAYETSVPASYRTAFISKVIAVSNRLGINPNWLMIVMYFETRRTFSPSVKNPNSTAVGLIQFTTAGASAIGTTPAKLATKSAVDQLDDVEKYLNQYKGKLTDLHQLYLAVFSPAYLGRPDAQKVYVSPSKEYTANKPLDTNNDGVITVAEIKTVISRYVPAGYEDVKPTDPVMPFVIAGAVGLLLHKILS